MRNVHALRWLAAALALVLAVGTAGAGAAEEAAEEVDGTIRLEARLDPPGLAPGGSGRLVVKATIGHDLHVYANDATGESTGLLWAPLPAAGVRYEVSASPRSWEAYEAKPGQVVWSRPTLYQDKNFPELAPFPVWTPAHPFTIEVPVTIEATAKPGTAIGLSVDYSACDEGMCYDRVRAQRAVAYLGAPGGVPAGAEGALTLVAPKPAGDEAMRVTLELDQALGIATVTFRPGRGRTGYMPGSTEGDGVLVTPLEDEGIAWGEVAYEDEGGHFEEPFTATIGFQRQGGRRLRVQAHWQVCDEAGTCLKDEAVLEARWVEGTPPGPAVPAPMIEPGEEPVPAPGAPAVAPGELRLVRPGGGVLFPVVHDDDLDAPRRDHGFREVDATMAPVARETSDLERQWRDSWVLFLGTVFLFGVGLAFTPCVLPIIPLTISVIGGGGAGRVSRGRLAVMLTAYVLGLSLTYGAAGAVSGSLGEAIDVEAAFRVPGVVWGIALLFLVLAAGMLGIFELQPPAWMERMRGGAARKSGTLLGSFLLGCLAAVIASPCTGPFVVAMLTFVATTGSPGIGFVLFFTLGLGMGAVFFAAGSLNLLARPGSWMVWVRYAFGVILVGVALYFLAAAGLLTTVPLFAAGFSLAILVWIGVARHLVRREGEAVVVAGRRGAVLAVALALVTGVVAKLTWPPAPAVGATAGGAGVAWLKLRDVEHLQAEVARASQQGRPVVVDVWADWCFYCREYDRLIDGDPSLREAFGQAVLLKVDESDESRHDLRRAVGLPTKGQPRMAFFDPSGRLRRAADVDRWYGQEGEEPAREMRRRIDFVLGRTGSPPAGRP